MAEDFERELQAVFLEEASQLLADAEQCFLSLESSPNDPALIEKIFRLAHNLKGSANAVGFKSLGTFTHELESYLLKIKSREIQIQASSVSLLLRCNDHIIGMVSELKSDPAATIDSCDLLLEIRAHITGHAEQSRPAPQAQVSEPPVSGDALQGFHSFSDPVEAPVSGDSTWTHPDAAIVRDTPRAQDAGKPRPVATATATATASDDSIRVSLQRVERLLNFVGEMVILQTVLREQVQLSNSGLLRKTVHQLGKVTKEVQDISMSLRMVQLKQTFQKMQRIVRDTSASLDKKIQFELRGEETELDKTILEKLSDPLVHLIRNAVDHGIESGEERLRAGKSESGHITLSAFHQSGSFMIEVRDDGSGLDAAKLRAKAVEKGLIKSGTEMSDRDAHNLIFHSGFSTKTAVTDVSGRGVGMDVVKTNIEQLQGEIQLETTKGKGTCFRIRLPLTLAIIDSMTVMSDSQRYVIPLSHVHESTKPTQSDVHFVSGLGEVYSLRGENLPLFRLSHMLGHKQTKTKEASDSIAIVVRNNNQAFAVLVDDIIGQNQVVIKQLGAEHKNLRGFSGSAIMGDGRAALIVELPELVSRFKASSGLGLMTNQRRSAG